jgi:GntR family transcriptional regulator/MocR family aminotransferase
VLYVGTFSKVLSPELRLGFVVAPEPLVARLATARRLVDGHSPLLTQRALARFLHDGMMARHLKRARQAYQARHDLVVRWLEGPGRSVGTAFAVGAGLHLALALRDDLDEAVLIDRARARGVLLEGLSKWATRVEVNGLALGFGGVGADQLPRVLECLERAAKRR